MTALVDALERGAATDDAVALTFDDGYVDNLTVAKPLLEAVDMPATIYLATGWIGGGLPFWWDELEALIFTPEPVNFAVTIGGRSVTIKLPTSVEGASQDWRYGKRARTAQESTYARLWTRLRNLQPDERSAIMDELRRHLPQSRVDPRSLPMSAEQAASLASPLIEVGAHTVTHTPLTRLSVSARRAEVERSGREASLLSGRMPNGFAYPHGDRDRATRTMVREAGYRYACSTRTAAIHRTSFDLFDLPRLMVEDWTGDELIGRMEALRS
jgi:peptidoglycan/xylan/chitin deacetylase (PgdA/CDA1 family)